MDLWHWNNTKVISTLWTLNYGDCVTLFFAKTSYSWVSEKHDQTFLNLTNVFNLEVNFQITLGLMKLNVCVYYIFPRLHSIMGGWGASPPPPPSPSPEIFWNFCGSSYNIQFKPCATSKMEFFVTNIGNSWKLLLIVVKDNLALNVIGLLDQTLKHIM